MNPSLVHDPRAIVVLGISFLLPALAISHRVYRRLPVFTIYLTLVAIVEVMRWLFIWSFGYSSVPTFWGYWTSDAILVMTRGIAVAEICYRILGPYVGVWHLARGILAAIAACLLLVAGISVVGTGQLLITFISTLGRGIEFATLGVLLSVILFARYYHVPVDRLVGMIAAGIIFYSAVQTANNEFLRTRLFDYFGVWNIVRMNSFTISSLLWLAAVWRPVRVQQSAKLLTPEVYGLAMPEMNLRLRQFNNRLTEILR